MELAKCEALHSQIYALSATWHRRLRDSARAKPGRRPPSPARAVRPSASSSFSARVHVCLLLHLPPPPSAAGHAPSGADPRQSSSHVSFNPARTPPPTSPQSG
ncbi:hypothetical protein PVAP13_7NG157717 [Panicum virgatum]|uniref:Uncharacterized protein n=1 Tax=Panicum virgatum TaxID=38727 RepID=A0A8T0Q4K9_PANVG|nr:hypothetical protein PVAP13_7NG157717 [Panicum virgatum]